MFDFYTQMIAEGDAEIERTYGETRSDWPAAPVTPPPTRKRNAHSKTCTELVEVMPRPTKKNSANTSNVSPASI